MVKAHNVFLTRILLVSSQRFSYKQKKSRSSLERCVDAAEQCLLMLDACLLRPSVWQSDGADGSLRRSSAVLLRLQAVRVRARHGAEGLQLVC